MQKRIVIETHRTHDPDTKGLQIRAVIETLGRELLFGHDPGQGEFENHAEAALALLSDIDEQAAVLGYGELKPNTYVFVTDLAHV